MRVKILERDVKKACLAYLHSQGVYAYNQRNTGTYDVRRSVFIPAPMRGLPDIVGYFGRRWAGHAGRAVYVEVKSPTGKPSPEQEFFIKEARESGCFACIAHGVDELEAELKVFKAK